MRGADAAERPRIRRAGCSEGYECAAADPASPASDGSAAGVRIAGTPARVRSRQLRTRQNRVRAFGSGSTMWVISRWLQ